MMRSLRTALGSLCPLVSAMSVSLLPLIFSTSWYRFNCHCHERCAHNIRLFFLHREPLAANWDPRGAAHPDDVRARYGQLALAAVVAVYLLAVLRVQHPGEVLWSLTPRVFFRNSAVMLLTRSASLCALLWWPGARRG